MPPVHDDDARNGRGGETIVAPASGPGCGVRAVVRMSGPAVKALLGRHVRGTPVVGGIVRASFMFSGGLELPCLLMGFEGPRSFTGEDAAELLIPGNAALVERVVRALVDNDGVRLARPGEFSARAYLAGKLTLEQAEGIAAGIAAETDVQLAAARRLLDGSRGREYRNWAEELATLLALVEAGIDFSDQEDVVPIAPDLLRSRVLTLFGELSGRLGSTAAWERGGGRPRVVLVGEPNAGKSTLFNALLGRRRAVVSAVAGTTRDAVREELDLAGETPGGCGVDLVDLPGLDADAREEIDAASQEQGRVEIERADAVIWCDPTGRFDRWDAGEERAVRPVIRVRTKADLVLGAGGVGGTEGGAIGVCALDGWHLPVLKRAIADAVQGVRAEDPEAAVLPRHRRALVRAAGGLRGALEAIPEAGARSLRSPELVAAGLREALDHLGEITGDVSPDDVLGRVFAVFCIGK